MNRRGMAMLLGGMLASTLAAEAAEAAHPVVFGTVRRLAPAGERAPQLDDAAFDQDLAEIVARAAGLPFRIAEFATAPEVIAALDRGEIDVIPSYARLPEREGKYLFSVRHTVSACAVFIRDGRRAPATVSEVGALRLAAAREGSAASYVRQKGWLDRTRIVATTEEALRAVASGDVDACLSNQLVGVSVLRQLKLDGRVTPVFTLPDSSVDFCMVVRLNEPTLLTRLNDGLLVASERGDLVRHREKWLPAFESYWLSRSNVKRWLLLGGAAVLVAAAAGWLWHRFQLRVARRHAAEIERQVELRTKELAAAIAQLRASKEALSQLNAGLEQRVNERTAELARHVTDVERLNRELEAFSYSVSHDLRAPLRNITGFTELLNQRTAGRLDADGERFVTQVSAEAKRMGRLIDDLLAFSHIGRVELADQSVDLGELVNEVRENLQPDIGARAVEWKIGPLPPVKGDRAMLRQVMANLLGNAIKFTRGRTPAVIEIAARQPGGAEARVTISVRDNGAGFNPKYGDKLFGVFQRLHNQRDFEGTGIGLANVKRIVTRHGGRVWAEGKLEQGATFYFTLKPVDP